MMRLKWTSKALSDLARLYEFLAPVSKQAAAGIVQSLAAAPTRLKEYPRIGEKLNEFEPREIRRLLVNHSRYATRSKGPPSMCCVFGIQRRIGNRTLSLPLPPSVVG